MNDDDRRNGMSACRARAGPAPDMLGGLTEIEFSAGLAEAERRRDESVATFARYRLWFERLEPYFARDPRATVADALGRYRADRANADAISEAGRTEDGGC